MKQDVTAKANEISTLTGGTVKDRLEQVPAGIRPLVQAVGEYRRQPVGGFATKDPMWKQVVAYAYQVYPNLDEKEWNARSKLMQSFTSGKDAAQIQATNTLANHLDALAQAATALKNGDIQILNKIANEIGVQVGKTPATTLKTIVHRVGPEVTQAYVGTGGEFAERKANEGDFSESMSPDQILNNVFITVKLLKSKVDSQENKWKTGMDREEFSLRHGGASFITPAAQSVFDKLSDKHSAKETKVQFSKSQYAKTHPDKDINDAVKRATAKGMEIID
jgi:hypothetical protein